jgi:hypothetical protein
MAKTQQAGTRSATDAEPRHAAKKIKPNQRGAIKLSRTHGEALVCVRYRENEDDAERQTTVEQMADRAKLAKQPEQWVVDQRKFRQPIAPSESPCNGFSEGTLRWAYDPLPAQFPPPPPSFRPTPVVHHGWPTLR